MFTGFLKTMEAKKILRLHIGKVAILTGDLIISYLNLKNKISKKSKLLLMMAIT
jgi:hypothetical protein